MSCGVISVSEKGRLWLFLMWTELQGWRLRPGRPRKCHQSQIQRRVMDGFDQNMHRAIGDVGWVGSGKVGECV